MTNTEKAKKLCEDILAVAPVAMISSVEEPWQAALLCAESYFKMQQTESSNASLEDSVVTAWTEGRYSSFIGAMYGIEVRHVHDILMRRGYHAPYYAGTDYSIREVNRAIQGDEKNYGLAAAIADTFVNGMTKQFPVSHPGVPNSGELSAIRKCISNASSIERVSEISGRPVSEVEIIFDRINSSKRRIRPNISENSAVL